LGYLLRGGFWVSEDDINDKPLPPLPSRDIDELRARLERLEMSWIERVNPEFVAGLGAGFFAGLVVAAILWSNG
jgi:hypothetical protein